MCNFTLPIFYCFFSIKNGPDMIKKCTVQFYKLAMTWDELAPVPRNVVASRNVLEEESQLFH